MAKQLKPPRRKPSRKKARRRRAAGAAAADAGGTSRLQARQAERRTVLLPPIPLNRSKRGTERKNR